VAGLLLLTITQRIHHLTSHTQHLIISRWSRV